MSPEIILLLVGAFAAAFVSGTAGFGDALIASAVWLHVLAPAETVPLVVSCFFVMHIFMLASMWRRLSFKYLWPFLVGGTIGVPLGTELLRIVEPDTFKRVAGIGLMIYGAVMLWATALPHITRGGRPLDGAVGMVGGVLGGFAGLSGFVPGVWCTQRGWSRAEARGVTQPLILTMHGMAFGWLAVGGMVPPETGTRFLFAMPAIAIGAWLGVKLYGYFNEVRFRQCVLTVLFIAGAILLLTPGGA